jgi:ubiquinone/menaquinone biosynthesis C-methylase UbiE
MLRRVRKRENHKTSEYWGKEAGTWHVGRGIHWTEHIAVQERLNKKITGDPYKDAVHFFVDFLTLHGMKLPLERCLTLGCGSGDLERSLSVFNFCLRHDAHDIAGEAIQRAREKALEEGLSHIYYDVSDINTLTLPPDAYDAIFGFHSIHHFIKLEHIFSEVRNALKQDGYFMLYEFVGPTKFQWTDKQLAIINNLLRILPEKYRVKKKDGAVKTICRRPFPKEMDIIDPSEAVRSGDILKILQRYFIIKEKKELGGAILHLLLQDIAGNFDCNKAEDTRLLNMLFEVEDTMMELGEIPSDFVIVIAGKK